MKISNKIRSVCWGLVCAGHLMLASLPTYSHRHMAFITGILALVVARIMWKKPN